MTLENGLYEQLINKLIENRLEIAGRDSYHIYETKLDKYEAATYLSQYLSKIIRFALNEIKEKDRTIKQIELSNKIIQLLVSELSSIDLEDNLIDTEGRILEAVFSKLDFPYHNFTDRVKAIRPYTRLSQSELFTGNNVGIPLESEIRKEILSSDTIYWLVSFIKHSGIRIFKKELEEFTGAGKELRIITTTYLGATDLKAIEYLANLPNTKIKISYNSEHERLHAKAYLFLRKTGFHTGYIGSSNISRSALTNGLEWNLKVTNQEISHIIDKFKKTFETYWEDNDFESYDPVKGKEMLQRSLSNQRWEKVSGQAGSNIFKTNLVFFDLKPFPFQEEILERLRAERQIHGRWRNLVVAATGTGKTMVAAFDYSRFREEHGGAKLLFVAHRREILEQAQQTFRHVLKDNDFGDQIWVGGNLPDRYDHLFVSVQTLNNHIENLELGEHYYDYIIIDEVHHIKAQSYRPILNKFSPRVLLGLTATPERMDGGNILEDFDYEIGAEIRLPEALNRKLLSPFQYFALSDSVDLSKVSWTKGRYEINELTRIYTEDDRRVSEILNNCNTYLTDMSNVRALGFCVSKEHAVYMAQKFSLAGLSSDYLTSDNSALREEMRGKLKRKEINYLFVVDIFNEGVDIPEVDTVLFLRPTESLTIFLQQLGRGLRLAPNKECLTVLDFVGNARPEYDFEHKFRALIGRTHTSIRKEIEDEFPHLPLGCAIVLERKARQIILDNIRKATEFRKPELIRRIQQFKNHSTLTLTLRNFIEFNQLDIRFIYKKGGWKRLCAEAKVIRDFREPNEGVVQAFISNRLLGCNSSTYLKFILRVISEGLVYNPKSEEEQLYYLMFHYDVWGESGDKLGFASIEESISILKRNQNMVSELEEVVTYLLSQVHVMEKEISLPWPFPLKVHSRYTRDQILVALRLHTFKKSSSNREGVAYSKELKAEALFVTLKKSEKDYSPTTMYEDYALNEYLFHWQSQNSAAPNTKKGKAYLHHRAIGRKILLFVREQNQDEFGYTMTYTFLGDVEYVKSEGQKPMNIEWRLKEPIPPYLLRESRKLATG